MKEQILRIAKDLEKGKITPDNAQNLLLGLFDVSSHKLFSIESGSDWADASVDYFINLTDKTGKEIHKEYLESGGFIGNGEKWFREWVVEKRYMREPTNSELEIFYNG